MPDYYVVAPEEVHAVVEWQQDDLPGVGAVNTALRDFEPKIVFAWHLAIRLQLEELAQRGMPTREERILVDRYGGDLGRRLKGDREKPNGLFLARLTWNGTRELVFRIYDPDVADAVLQREIADEAQVRHFEYRMRHDPEWALAKWHLEAEISE